MNSLFTAHLPETELYIKRWGESVAFQFPPYAPAKRLIKKTAKKHHPSTESIWGILQKKKQPGIDYGEREHFTS